MRERFLTQGTCWIVLLATWLLLGCGGGRDTTTADGHALKAVASFPGVEPESGIWWNPAQSGRGYAIELQGTVLSLGAYMYETNGAPVWYLAALTRQADGSFAGTMSRYSGGQTLAGAYRAPTGVAVIASVRFTAQTPTTGSLLVQPTDGSASVTTSIQRFSFSTPATPSKVSFQSGLWWDPSQSGRGFFVDVQGTQAAISSYMYDETGQPVWYLTAAAVTGTLRTQGTMDGFAGGQTLTGAYRAPSAGPSGGGMIFNALDSTTANLTLPNGTVLALKRFQFGSTELCEGSTSTDVFSGLQLKAVHPIGAKPHSCLIVDSRDGFPVKSGSKSLRIEVRPGDCSSNQGFDDCTTDRARHEVGEFSAGKLANKTVTYTTNLFIPSQARLRPSGGSLLVLSQVNIQNSSFFGALAYLVVTRNGELAVQTHEGFSFQIRNIYPVGPVPYDRWVTVRYEVKSSVRDDGYLRVHVDGAEIVNEVRATAPTADTDTFVRLGIYNSFKAAAVEPYLNQVVFFDDISKVARE
jgi:hypothetical protein